MSFWSHKPLNLQEIKDMEAKKNIKGLVNALRYKEDSQVRREAAVALVVALEYSTKYDEIKTVKALCAALKDTDEDVRSTASKSIETLMEYCISGIGRYRNDNEYQRILLAFTKELGQIRDDTIKMAIRKLIGMIEPPSAYNSYRSLPDKLARIRTAMVLVRWYKSGKLSEDHKRRILEQQATITKKHEDSLRAHDDSIPSSDCREHSDYRPHDDSGIGVRF